MSCDFFKDFQKFMHLTIFKLHLYVLYIFSETPSALLSVLYTLNINSKLKCSSKKNINPFNSPGKKLATLSLP